MKAANILVWQLAARIIGITINLTEKRKIDSEFPGQVID